MVQLEPPPILAEVAEDTVETVETEAVVEITSVAEVAAESGPTVEMQALETLMLVAEAEEATAAGVAEEAPTPEGTRPYRVAAEEATAQPN